MELRIGRRGACVEEEDAFILFASALSFVMPGGEQIAGVGDAGRRTALRVADALVAWIAAQSRHRRSVGTASRLRWLPPADDAPLVGSLTGRSTAAFPGVPTLLDSGRVRGASRRPVERNDELGSGAE